MPRPYPYYIAALLDGFAMYTNNGRDPYHKPMTMRYTYRLPNRATINQLKVRKKLVESATSLQETTIQRIENSVALWSEGAQIDLIKDDKNPDIYLMSNVLDAHASTFAGEVDLSLHPKYGRMIYRPYFVLYNENLFNEWEREGFAGKVETVVTHEFPPHPLTYEHPFQFTSNYRDTLFPVSQQNTWFSALNYDVVLDENYRPVYRVSPAEFDRETSAFAFGSRVVSPGDDVYDLFPTIHASKKYCVVKTLADSNGTDTFNARGYTGRAIINLRNGVNEYSRIENNYIMLAYGTEIENVVGGDGENLIFLNSMNNNIDVSHSNGPQTVVTFRYGGGQDIIKGFNPMRGDILRVEKPWSDTSHNLVKISPQIKPRATVITIEDKNTITLLDVDSQTITTVAIQFAKSHDPRQCQQLTDAPIKRNTFLNDAWHSDVRKKDQLATWQSPVIHPPKKEEHIDTSYEYPAEPLRVLADCPAQISAATKPTGIWCSFFKSAESLLQSSSTYVSDFLQTGMQYLEYLHLPIAEEVKRQILHLALAAIVQEAINYLPIPALPTNTNTTASTLQLTH